MTKFLIPFFICPISILQELSISFNINRKNAKTNFHIPALLDPDSINSQLIPSDYFHSHKFNENWPYTGMDIKDY